MKKINLFFIVPLLVFASCTRDEEPSVRPCDELSFFNVVKPGVKGYLADGTFYDVTIASLHSGTGGAHEVSDTPRKMNLSAWLTPQNGSPETYFRNYVFESDNNDETPLWHHTPAIYWPVGGVLDFLAYSVMQPFDERDVTWDESNPSSAVTINVHDARYRQDDIAFCSAFGKASSAGASPVGMEFKHAQAWLEFRFSVSDASMADKIAIESVVLEDVYSTGYLTIRNNAGSATGEWNFRHEVAENLVFDDFAVSPVCGSHDAESDVFALTNALTADCRYMDMLIPEQGRTAFVVNYVLAGQPNKLSYRFPLTNSATWQMGSRYVYDVVFSINELTVNPIVTAYEDGEVSDLSGEII